VQAASSENVYHQKRHMDETKNRTAIGRRSFMRSSAALAVGTTRLTGSPQRPSETARTPEEPHGSITDVGGIRVGHFTDTRRPTGCTVVIFDKPAVAGVDVGGPAPGTRETDLLNPINTVQHVNAILLSGGSAFGLDAASGVMHYLEEHGLGFRMGQIIVPIVPAAILFDLNIGDPKIRPNAESGYAACQSASDVNVSEGNAGAGAGATVGKLFGTHSAMKGGIGTASLKIGNSGLIVGAIIAVNSVGDVLDPKTGNILAGARTPEGNRFRNSMAQIISGQREKARLGENSTIGVVATNAALNKDQATRMARMAQDGLARTINPIHTDFDGDALFAASTGRSQIKADLTTIGSVAAEVVGRAVLRAVIAAAGIAGYPAHRDLVR
jgi:L-aminopeptidase/D-esterase-like protein